MVICVELASASSLKNSSKDPDAKSSDLNVARQFLRDNGIDAVPTDGSPLKKLVDELPFEIPTKPEITH